MLRKNFFILFLFLFYSFVRAEKPKEISFESRVVGAILASAIGDALGRIPEISWINGGPLSDENYYARFLRTKFYKDFPNGIRSFADFRKIDFVGGKAIYTDDTQMSLLVLEELLEEEERKKADSKDVDDCDVTNRIMVGIAKRFGGWVIDPDGGLCFDRAPGIGCLKGASRLRKGIRSLENKTEEFEPTWWAEGEGGFLKPFSEGGCGSVMRSYPFGILYCNDIERAKKLAERHSLLTHRAYMARAACASMAAGMAKAMTGASKSVVLKSMVDTAGEYDEKTSKLISEAVKKASQKLSEKEIRDYLESLEGRFAHQAIAAGAFLFGCESKDLLRGLRLSIFYGDSDSVGAIYGALVGAFCGAEILLDKKNYKSFVEPLENSEKLISIAKKVAAGFDNK